MVEDLGGGLLGDGAVHHDGHLVCEAQGLLLVVGDEDRRRARVGEDVAHLRPHPDAQRGVEVGERLVEQHDLGAGGERAGQRHPLLLPPGELVGHPPAEAFEVGEV